MCDYYKYHLPQNKSHMQFLFHFASDHNTASVFVFPTVKNFKIYLNIALLGIWFTIDIL